MSAISALVSAGRASISAVHDSGSMSHRAAFAHSAGEPESEKALWRVASYGERRKRSVPLVDTKQNALVHQPSECLCWCAPRSLSRNLLSLSPACSPSDHAETIESTDSSCADGGRHVGRRRTLRGAPCVLVLWTLRCGRRGGPARLTPTPPPGGLVQVSNALNWKEGGGRSFDAPGRGVCDTKVLLCDKTVRDDRQPPGVDEQAEGVGAG